MSSIVVVFSALMVKSQWVYGNDMISNRGIYTEPKKNLYTWYLMKLLRHLDIWHDKMTFRHSSLKRLLWIKSACNGFSENVGLIQQKYKNKNCKFSTTELLMNLPVTLARGKPLRDYIGVYQKYRENDFPGIIYHYLSNCTSEFTCHFMGISI